MNENGTPELSAEVLAKLPKPNMVALPAEAASVLRDLDAACGDVLRRLGSLESDYLNTKAALLDELRARRAQFKTLVDDSAKKTGVDTVNERWNFDASTMTLNRAN